MREDEFDLELRKAGRVDGEGHELPDTERTVDGISTDMPLTIQRVGRSRIKPFLCS